MRKRKMKTKKYSCNVKVSTMNKIPKAQHKTYKL